MPTKHEFCLSPVKDSLVAFNTSRARFFRGGCALLMALLALVLPARAQKRAKHDADFSRLIVVGDSISAGFQSGSLLDTQQVHGYANLIAQQAGADLHLPLIAPPGIPNVLELVSPGPPPIIVTALGKSPGRENPFIQTFDLAIPGARLHDVLATRPGFPIDDFTDFILGLPGLLVGPPISRSQVEWAEAIQPTTIVLWVGNNDALGAAVGVNTALLTPVAQFKADYHVLMNRLSATGAKIVVANIPDVTVIPSLTPAEKVAQKVGLPLAIIGPILGIQSGDFVTLGGLQLILDILSNPSLGPLPSSVVLRAAQAAQIRNAVDAYNETIEDEAHAHDAALVDVHKFLNRIHLRGFFVDDQKLTTDFLGGIFSLDGVHPTNTGYALIANKFIASLNRRFDADLEPVSVEEIAEHDPLVIPHPSDLDSVIEQIDKDAVRSIRSVLTHHKGQD